MGAYRMHFLFAVAVAVLSGCASIGANGLPRDETGIVARLRAQDGLRLEDAGRGWAAVEVTGDDKGAESGPDGAFSAGADVDLDGDGRPERIRQERATVTSQIYTISASGAPGARVLLSAEASTLLVSTGRESNGWPVLGLESRDYDDGKSVEARIIRTYAWNGVRYEPADVRRRPR